MEGESVLKKSGISTYFPLLIIIFTILLASLSLSKVGVSPMHSFMGLFFMLFAMFKFLDLPGFAKGFKQYDLLASRWPWYGYAYPIVELLLGMAYLAHFLPVLLYIVTFGLMAVSSIGVIRSVVTRKKIKCACLGTLLDVPLSVVSILENVGMGFMALWMLFHR